MNNRSQLLARILETCRTRGTSPPEELTRTAFEAGHLDRFEVPEILLALHTGDLRIFGTVATPASAPPVVEACAA
jgi:hypothetical protein